MANTDFYAHSLTGRPEDDWEKLEEHLQKVADLAARFAAAFEAEEWGRLAGLWHDLGKYRPEFQERLRGSRESVEHAGIGAALAEAKDKARGRLLAFAIAGHHAGLTNPESSDEAPGAPLSKRLEANRPLLPGLLPSIPERLTAPLLPPLPPRKDLAGLELWTRFLFSSLVDADYLATEDFYTPGLRARARQGQDEIPVLRQRLDEHLDRLVSRIPLEDREADVNRRRAEVLAACRAAAEEKPGLFSLTVPTGGGKTLAAMAFALLHAQRHGLRRVVAAIPFTSIIEQNAKVYREALGDANVVEHHSALDPLAAEERNREAEIRRRLAAENWDAPVIVTTNVQLFESLFANSTSRCRKLHNLAGSVILLDEAQALPPEFLLPVLDALRELVLHYGCTVVLSTATQPALTRRAGFPGLEGVQEIIPDPGTLARSLERVQVDWPDPDGPPLSYADLARKLVDSEKVLAVVHRRRDARTLAELLPEEGRFHLSALMCPAHRSKVLDEVRTRLKQGGSCRLVSTQLIEAGVDVDFPFVFRALGGLDSLAQAAGRCNREGRLSGKGKVVIFLAETAPPKGIPLKGLEAIRGMLQNHGGTLELTNPDLYTEYFRNLYLRCDLDEKGIQPQRRGFNFATVARRFQLIEDGSTQPVVVPYGLAEERLDALRRSGPDRLLLRSLQPFLVNISRQEVDLLRKAGALELVAETVLAVTPIFRHLYHPDFGLTLDGAPQPDPEGLVV